MAIRAVFIDIDGTLLDWEENISPQVHSELLRVHKQGCEIVLCTGRTRYTAEPILNLLPFSGQFLVCSNGAVVVDVLREEVLQRVLLTDDQAKEVVQLILESGATPYVYNDSATPGLTNAAVLYPPSMSIGHFAESPRYQPHANLELNIPFQPVSVAAFDSAELLRPLAEQLRQKSEGRLAVIQSGNEFSWGVEVYNQGVSKRMGMQTMATHLGIEQDEILAIGDHMNDIEMLQWAGVGVAMGNALPEVKAVANWVTQRNSEDGVAIALKKYI